MRTVPRGFRGSTFIVLVAVKLLGIVTVSYASGGGIASNRTPGR
jgi:hypothetical protein